MAFLSPAAGRDDYARLLASPAQFLPSPLAQGLFASPAPEGSKATFAVQSGRLSFDVLLHDHQDNQENAQGASALEAFRDQEDDAAPKEAVLKGIRSASHLELFALAPVERTRLADPAGREAAPAPAAATSPADKQQLHAALTQRVLAKVVQAKQLEVQDLVMGVAAKYGLAADYSQVEETIKAVWTEHQGHSSQADSEDGALAAADMHAGAPAQQQQVAGADELTLADQGQASTEKAAGDEAGSQQATSVLKPLAQGTGGEGSNALKRPLAASQPSFCFQTAGPSAADAASADDAAQKKRRVHYDRMRELEAHVQRVRHLGNALSQSLSQAEVQHNAITMENEQLWNALLHIHASLRAAHAAHVRQQAAVQAATMAAALPAPQQDIMVPSPNTLFGGLFSPDADELAAACGMFVSPAKPSAATTAANKPRKLFLEDETRVMLGSTGRGLPASRLGDMHAAVVPPALWVQAA